jgi:hypothetical protein
MPCAARSELRLGLDGRLEKRVSRPGQRALCKTWARAGELAAKLQMKSNGFGPRLVFGEAFTVVVTPELAYELQQLRAEERQMRYSGIGNLGN